MSHNSSAARSSRSSPRYDPYSHSPTPASSRRLPRPSAPLSGHDAERSSPDNYLSPAHAYYLPTMNSATGYSAVPSSLNSQPTYAMPSASTHQLGHSTHQTNSFPHPPAHLAQILSFQHPYHPAPATNTRYLAPIHSQTNFQPVQPPISIHQPDSTYQNYAIHQHHHQLHTTQPEQVVTQQGQTYYGDGMFKNPRDFTVTNSTFIDNSNTSDNFMNKFLQHTIIGAEFDSSDRHPPPKCHPGTRLAIIERCKNFIVQCDGKEKMHWVVGGAGVGKSAIMQIVAEETPADASVFFSVNGRKDGARIFTTIAYQLATKHEPYRQFIWNAIDRDPSLLHKSLPAQFQKFIVDPFIHRHVFNPSQRFVIIIDGLDECDNPKTQREILRLISDFCIKYTASPYVWFVASRPEPHITSFFDSARVTPAYTKEEIAVDSDEACKGVQRYLRDELNEVKLAYPTLRHKREWPSGLEFTKIAKAAGGLFAYASTVVRYIGNSHYRDPATLLCHVLEVIGAGSKHGALGGDHPMALLDALYQRILDSIPPDVMITTRKLLLTTLWHRAIPSTGGSLQPGKFRYNCNMLGLSEAAAYSAISYLHAVLNVLAPDKADVEDVEFFHKSFRDFLFDFERSGFSPDAEHESNQLLTQCSLGIVTQVSDDFVDSRKIELGHFGCLRGCLGFCDNISLSWPSDERFRVSDDELRLTLFPIYILRDYALEEYRPELTTLGKMKEVPLRTLDYAAIFGSIDIWFTSPIGTDVKEFGCWNPSCKHVKEDIDGLPQQRIWATDFRRRLVDNSGDDMAHVDITWFNIEVELSFVDPEDVLIHGQDINRNHLTVNPKSPP
ncbi:hypothetical protein AGABI2DRAFT_177088 [Agaricus bisporus var. bisporus H97]|uniref:hypothetical protein n=1 Tax=Agaricus bisporus var. bisporus (strain H97 / ATCC MYA-4626 / FGSC 10389) TaxID=936046 RepID=UPI00029F571C|nr:hypothetical protein AGABI2DRAFT_177088 [Agaricus bisporus var. bisporus H97]EKV48879.1 hypothetical protein AGABI2DRAFT_177088 [Agaricus bisporus var. bisporus H97]